MGVDILLSQLRKVKKVSPTSWMACCSAHDDRSASLKITQGKDGKTLIHCFAGCTPIDILGAVGLDIDDLFDDAGYESKPIRGTHVYPREVLKSMIPELMLMLTASFKLRKGEALNEVDQARFILSYTRLMNAIELAEAA